MKPSSAKLASATSLSHVGLYLTGVTSLQEAEVRFVLDTETSDPTDVGMYQHKEANSMVEEFMLLANISVAWVIINMVPFGMALGYAYLPHNKNVHGLLVSLSWTAYAMCGRRSVTPTCWNAQCFWHTGPIFAATTRSGWSWISAHVAAET